MMLQADTIVELFARRVEADGPKPALAVKREGKYEWLTWDKLAVDVQRVAAGLVSLGVQPGERVALVSENRYEWIVCDLAIQLARGVHVPIHPTLAGPQIAWQLRHCECRVAFLSGPQQAAKLAPLAEELSADLQWFSFDRCEPGIGGRPIEAFDALCERGSAAEGRRVEKIARAGVGPDS